MEYINIYMDIWNFWVSGLILSYLIVMGSFLEWGYYIKRVFFFIKVVESRVIVRK